MYVLHDAGAVTVLYDDFGSNDVVQLTSMASSNVTFAKVADDLLIGLPGYGSIVRQANWRCRVGESPT
jgi:hypothetical protein